MNQELLKLWLENGNAHASINVYLLGGIIIVAGATWLFSRKTSFLGGKPDIELKVKLGGIGTVTIKPNYEVRQIAHKAWVELKTRKAGLPIDKDNDVIGDVYASWYDLFKEIRTLARDVPTSKLKDPDTSQLVQLLIDSLNDGLRPHLTKWRAKYSRWYEKAVADSEHDTLTPQDIQRKYPEYQDLVDDMLKINKQLVQYTDEIKKLVDA